MSGPPDPFTTLPARPAATLSVGVSVLIQDERGRVLLQRRGDDGRWGTPGGHLNPGESFLQAAQRELFEETGLICPDLRLMPLPDALIDGPAFRISTPRGDRYQVGLRTRGTLSAAALDLAAPDDSGETLALAWFPLTDLPHLSGAINVASLNLLRREQGLPELPLPPA
ncbi:NUDIX domain-containing protein [Deinococcus caeni]|uniref:RNA pyrophosphohydrolase n=1 Tax=Deinococcus caeni TaxID=569127 RepID=A0ABP9UI70_9DEIO